MENTLYSQHDDLLLSASQHGGEKRRRHPLCRPDVGVEYLRQMIGAHGLDTTFSHRHHLLGSESFAHQDAKGSPRGVTYADVVDQDIQALIISKCGIHCRGSSFRTGTVCPAMDADDSSSRVLDEVLQLR